MLLNAIVYEKRKFLVTGLTSYYETGSSAHFTINSDAQDLDLGDDLLNFFF